MSFMYGAEDHLDCLAYPATTVSLPADQFPGEQMCIGYRYTVHWAGIPYWISDEGYVLTTQRGKQYISLKPDAITELQGEGSLPAAMPPYAIPIGWRMGQIASYGLIAALIAAAAWRARGKRQLRKARGTAAITTTGPVLEKRGDREIAEAMRAHLEAGEHITHQALAWDRKPDSVGNSLRGQRHLVALTDRRLLLSTSKIGLFGGFRGKPHLRPIPRDHIVSVLPGDEDLTLHVRDTDVSTWSLRLIVPLAPGGFSRANQRAFLLDLPRLLAVAADSETTPVQRASTQSRTVSSR